MTLILDEIFKVAHEIEIAAVKSHGTTEWLTQESHVDDMAQHLVDTHVTRKHDGIIFAGLSEGYEQLLKSIELMDQMRFMVARWL